MSLCLFSENPAEDFLKTIEDELAKGLKEKRHTKRSLSTGSSNQQSGVSHMTKRQKIF